MSGSWGVLVRGSSSTFTMWFLDQCALASDHVLPPINQSFSTCTTVKNHKINVCVCECVCESVCVSYFSVPAELRTDFGNQPGAAERWCEWILRSPAWFCEAFALGETFTGNQVSRNFCPPARVRGLLLPIQMVPGSLDIQKTILPMQISLSVTQDPTSFSTGST